MPAKATEIKQGMAIIYDDQLHLVLDTEHVKPGKGPAYVQAKMKNVKSGSITTKRLNSADKFETAEIDRTEMEYLYDASGTGQGPWVFMDRESYEQVEIGDADLLPDWKTQWLKPNITCMFETHDGRPLNIELPQVVEVEVTDTTPQPRGATVTNQLKDATVETGAQIKVPPFIEVGQLVRVKTENGEYLGKA